MEEDYITFDRVALKRVVHVVIANCNPDNLGSVKLHKILYFADMLHFTTCGTPLTGVDYVKQKFGPTARHLRWALDALVSEGKIRIETENYFGFEKKRYITLSQPRSEDLTNQSRAILDEVMSFVVEKSAREISELSHNEAWEVAEMGERIPYAAALAMQAVEVTEEDIEECVQEAIAIRSSIEADAVAN